LRINCNFISYSQNFGPKLLQNFLICFVTSWYISLSLFICHNNGLILLSHNNSFDILFWNKIMIWFASKILYGFNSRIFVLILFFFFIERKFVLISISHSCPTKKKITFLIFLIENLFLKYVNIWCLLNLRIVHYFI
jgi:hypothetical protein